MTTVIDPQEPPKLQVEFGSTEPLDFLDASCVKFYEDGKEVELLPGHMMVYTRSGKRLQVPLPEPLDAKMICDLSGAVNNGSYKGDMKLLDNAHIIDMRDTDGSDGMD